MNKITMLYILLVALEVCAIIWSIYSVYMVNKLYNSNDSYFKDMNKLMQPIKNEIFKDVYIFLLVFIAFKHFITAYNVLTIDEVINEIDFNTTMNFIVFFFGFFIYQIIVVVGGINCNRVSFDDNHIVQKKLFSKLVSIDYNNIRGIGFLKHGLVIIDNQNQRIYVDTLSDNLLDFTYCLRENEGSYGVCKDEIDFIIDTIEQIN